MRCLEAKRIIEILRLWDMGCSQREIAASIKCGKSTVGDVQRRCKDAGVTYERATRLTNNEIRGLLYPDSTKHHEQGARRYWTLFHKPKPSKNLLVKEQVRILSLFRASNRLAGTLAYVCTLPVLKPISSVSVSGSYLTLVILREKLSRSVQLINASI